MVRKYQDSVSVLKFYWNISTFSTFEFNARSACDLLCECAFACLRSTLSNCRFLSNNSIVVTVPDEISRLNTSTHALHSLVMDYSWPIVIMLSDGSWGGGQRLIDYRVPAQPARPTIHCLVTQKHCTAENTAHSEMSNATQYTMCAAVYFSLWNITAAMQGLACQVSSWINQPTLFKRFPRVNLVTILYDLLSTSLTMHTVRLFKSTFPAWRTRRFFDSIVRVNGFEDAEWVTQHAPTPKVEPPSLRNPPKVETSFGILQLR